VDTSCTATPDKASWAGEESLAGEAWAPAADGFDADVLTPHRQHIEHHGRLDVLMLGAASDSPGPRRALGEQLWRA
jgi:hypothetical protein